MKKIIFSIIIPVRKKNNYVAETLSYLKKQTLKDFEVLVITDKISKIPNPSFKRNLGAKLAKGKYLAFLDDDSYPHKDWLKNALVKIESENDICGVCGPCLTPPKNNYKQKASGLVWSSVMGSGGAGVYRNSIKKERYVDDYPTVNLIIKKDDFNKVNGFDEKYWPGEDTILCLKLTKELNKKILYSPNIRVFHHRREAIIPHLQQITRYAKHRGLFAKKFPQTSLRIGYLIPSLFTLYLITLIPINIFIYKYKIIFNLPLYLYLSILLITLISFLKNKNSIKASLLATITIPLTHIYYGILFIIGLLSKDINFKKHKINKKTGEYIGG